MELLGVDGRVAVSGGVEAAPSLGGRGLLCLLPLQRVDLRLVLFANGVHQRVGLQVKDAGGLQVVRALPRQRLGLARE